MQEMLMQTHGGKIRLLPAWPKEWDVDFKLHAPGQTTVEGKARSGRMTYLKVTPKERQNDQEPRVLPVPLPSTSSTTPRRRASRIRW